MTKISQPPPRSPGSVRAQQRPTERRRASRGQAAQGTAPSQIDELDEDELGIDEQKEVGSSDHHGERPDTQEQAWQRMEEFRRRGNTDSGQAQAREQRDAREGISAQHLTAEVQKQAQGQGSRSIFGARTQSSESLSRVSTSPGGMTPSGGVGAVGGPGAGMTPSGGVGAVGGPGSGMTPSGGVGAKGAASAPGGMTPSGGVGAVGAGVAATGGAKAASGAAPASGLGAASAPSTPVPTARPSAPLNAHGLLATGKAVGSFVRELALASLTDSDLHVQLRAAVGEAQRLLSGKDGIGRVALGEDKDARPVVLVVARRGVSLQQLLATVPEAVQGIATRISIPFDVLPLRRSSLSGTPPGGLSR
ncbi:hypothetical protein LZ198_09815 [Myxococcus sp. K15C18031901]|uniref:hypothetical protein n=1 Tax=Myxococcus dinghuensis TaxID=2906761 RepID=UPI0020A7F65E|nr:hypothetical protein [Myxococcus dinghuensis]MCP3099164.1 hypothetical protein [Myxococcus dinghuensis]